MYQHITPSPAAVQEAIKLRYIHRLMLISGYLASISRRPDIAAILAEDYRELFGTKIQDAITH